MSCEREHPKCVNLFFCSDDSLARFLHIREQDAPTKILFWQNWDAPVVKNIDKGTNRKERKGHKGKKEGRNM